MCPCPNSELVLPEAFCQVYALGPTHNNVVDYKTFKKYLKTYLFNLSFQSMNQTCDCVKRPRSNLSRLRRCNVVINY